MMFPFPGANQPNRDEPSPGVAPPQIGPLGVPISPSPMSPAGGIVPHSPLPSTAPPRGLGGVPAFFNRFQDVMDKYNQKYGQTKQALNEQGITTEIGPPVEKRAGPFDFIGGPIAEGARGGANLWESVSIDRDKYKPAMEDIIERYRRRLGGLTGGEMEATRAAAEQQIGGKYQTGMRNLLSQQARSGVRGGAAQAGMMDLAERRGRATSDFERDLTIRNEEVMRRALQDYDRAMTGERFGYLGTSLGAGNLALQQDATQKYLDAINAYFNPPEQRASPWDGGSVAELDMRPAGAQGIIPETIRKIPVIGEPIAGVFGSI